MGRTDSPLRDRMIFAFGAQRSGTWWLQRMLTAHPEVSAVPSETYLFKEGIAPFFERFHHGLKSSTTVAQVYVERDVLIEATREFCDAVLAAHLEPGARYLSERSPGHAHTVGLIHEVYPDARLIHIVRDGRDVARSLAAREWGPGSVAEAARSWREAVAAAREQAPADGYLEVRYEQLLADHEAGLRALYEWLGLEAGPDVLEEALRVARRPLNEDPGDARLAQGKWRDHFSEADLEAFEEQAGDLLAELGYADGARPRVSEQAVAAPAPEPPERAPAAAGVARRLAGRARRALRPDPPVPAPAPEPIKWEVGGALGTAARVADDLLQALQTGSSEALRPLLGDDVSLRVLDGVGEKRFSGAAAVVEQLAGDPAFRGRQLRGEMHPGIPNYTLVLGYELADGSRAGRVVALDVRGPRVEAVTVHRVPWPAS